MTRLLSVKLLFLVMFVLHPTTFAARTPRPESPEEEPPLPAPAPVPAGAPAHTGGGTSNVIPGSSTPFTVSESDPPEDLAELAKKVAELINDMIDLFGPSSTTSSVSFTAFETASPSSPNTAAAPTTSIPTQLNATLGCEIYQAYTSLCPPTTVPIYTSTIFLNIVKTINQAASDRASCLCYSSAYFVPGVYDDAASACAGYTDTVATFTDAAAEAALTNSFCHSMGNVRVTPAFATFGEFTAAAKTSSSAPPTATSSVAATTSTVGAGNARRVPAAKWWIWTCAAAVVGVPVLV